MASNRARRREGLTGATEQDIKTYSSISLRLRRRATVLTRKLSTSMVGVLAVPRFNMPRFTQILRFHVLYH